MSDKFGLILLDMQVISAEQLKEALTKQQDEMKGKKIGSILVRCGYIARHHIKDALRVQKPELSEEELESEIAGDPMSVTMDYYKAPRPKWPDVSIIIEQVNGVGSAFKNSGILCCELYRKAGETNEQLAERAGREIKQEVLSRLSDCSSIFALAKSADDGATAEYLRSFLKAEPAQIQAADNPDHDANPVKKEVNTNEFDLIVKIIFDGAGDIHDVFRQVAERYLIFFATITKPMLHADIKTGDEAAQKKYRSDMDRYEAAEQLAEEFKKYLAL